MTFTLDQKTIGKYYMEIAQDKGSDIYKVILCVEAGNSGLYRELNTRYYWTRKQADTRFSYLKRKANKGEL